MRTCQWQYRPMVINTRRELFDHVQRAVRRIDRIPTSNRLKLTQPTPVFRIEQEVAPWYLDRAVAERAPGV